MTDAVLRLAVVQLSGQRCGVLEQLANGSTRFRYDSEWLARRDARPVSQTMPLRTEPYELLCCFRSSPTCCPKAGCSMCRWRS